MWYLHSVGGLDARLVEQAVAGSGCRGGVVLGGDRDDFDIFLAGDAEDGFGKVVPRSGALVGEVVDTRHPLMALEDADNSRSKVARTRSRWKYV